MDREITEDRDNPEYQPHNLAHLDDEDDGEGMMRVRPFIRSKELYFDRQMELGDEDEPHDYRSQEEEAYA